MGKFIVVIFSDGARTYEGSIALKALHEEGALTVFATAIVARDANGVLSIEQSGAPGPLGFGVGALVGGLVGLLARSEGAVVGGFRDIINAGVGMEFVRTVSERLPPGRSALVAEVAEDRVTPLDTRMATIGGSVIRECRSDFEDDQIEKEARARQVELAGLQAELSTAKPDTRAHLNVRMAETKAKLSAVADRAEECMYRLQAEVRSKTTALQRQAATVKGDIHDRIAQHITQLREDYHHRASRLRRAL